MISRFLVLQTKLQLDGAKASEYLRRFLAGDPSIKLPRLSFAMQHMYNTDEDFQGSVDRWAVFTCVHTGLQWSCVLSMVCFTSCPLLPVVTSWRQLAGGAWTTIPC
jgi:hypothetical protein